jgi:hypothetical protein
LERIWSSLQSDGGLTCGNLKRFVIVLCGAAGALNDTESDHNVKKKLGFGYLDN